MTMKKWQAHAGHCLSFLTAPTASSKIQVQVRVRIYLIVSSSSPPCLLSISLVALINKVQTTKTYHLSPKYKRRQIKIELSPQSQLFRPESCISLLQTLSRTIPSLGRTKVEVSQMRALHLAMNQFHYSLKRAHLSLTRLQNLIRSLMQKANKQRKFGQDLLTVRNTLTE